MDENSLQQLVTVLRLNLQDLKSNSPGFLPLPCSLEECDADHCAHLYYRWYIIMFRVWVHMSISYPPRLYPQDSMPAWRIISCFWRRFGAKCCRWTAPRLKHTRSPNQFSWISNDHGIVRGVIFTLCPSKCSGQGRRVMTLWGSPRVHSVQIDHIG